MANDDRQLFFFSRVRVYKAEAILQRQHKSDQGMSSTVNWRKIDSAEFQTRSQSNVVCEKK